jgi:hypothetical protein
VFGADIGCSDSLIKRTRVLLLPPPLLLLLRLTAPAAEKTTMGADTLESEQQLFNSGKAPRDLFCGATKLMLSRRDETSGGTQCEHNCLGLKFASLAFCSVIVDYSESSS